MIELFNKQKINIHIEDIKFFELNSCFVKKFSLDKPTICTTNSLLNFSIAGWIATDGERKFSLKLVNEGILLSTIPIELPRQDAVDFMQNQGQSCPLNCGFFKNVGLLGLPPEFKILLIADIESESGEEGNTSVPLCQISGKLKINHKVTSKYQPVSVTSLGRSGSTWFMSLLKRHHEILVAGDYPYEIKQAAYWLQLFKLLNDPADFEYSSHPDRFDVTTGNLGTNPYYLPYYINSLPNNEQLQKYYDNEHLINSANFSAAQISNYYRFIASAENKPKARLFAEKVVPAHLQNVIRMLYKAPREIVLIRDFRDLICSATAFNSKRGRVTFGREFVDSDLAWVDQFAESSIKRLADVIETRGNELHVVKYEQLVNEPLQVLQGVFEYLNIDSSKKVIKAVLQTDTTPNPSMQEHKTSNAPTSSIGRWKRDMSPELQVYCKDKLGHYLSLFGYEL